MHPDRYEEGVEHSELPESQQGAIGWQGLVRIRLATARSLRTCPYICAYSYFSDRSTQEPPLSPQETPRVLCPDTSRTRFAKTNHLDGALRSQPARERGKLLISHQTLPRCKTMKYDSRIPRVWTEHFKFLFTIQKVYSHCENLRLPHEVG